MARVSINDIKEMKQRGEKIPMLTAYDYTSAKLVDAAGVPMILVGDSLGMVVLGYENTIPVTIEEMLHHTRAVVRGAQHALIVGDMPFMTYQASTEEAMHNAGRFLKEAGCQAIKLEGGETMAHTVEHLVRVGIPVQGHIGMTPQSANQFGGHRLQGRRTDVAVQIIKDAIALEEAGVFSIVLELVPAPLAKLVTERVKVPIIGIGAGPHCDGQVQIFHDLLGSFTDFVPRHAKQYANLATVIKDAITTYSKEIKDGTFPTMKQSFTMDESILAEVIRQAP